MQQTKIYFPNLNGIRFIAAALVIVHHIEQLKSLSGLEGYWGSVPAIEIIGKLGVVLFFVLSGFLITYLLLAEEETFQTISIPKFYIRRILRIWPLYFLILFLAFAVIPQISWLQLPGFTKEAVYQDLGTRILLYALFFPNLVLSLMGVVPYASHTWSIGTEEQFYLLWPVLLKYIRKNRLWLMGFIVVGYVALAFFLKSNLAGHIPYSYQLSGFLSLFNIDCMAIGGIFAILLYRKNPLLAFLQNTGLFYVVLVSVVFLMAKGWVVPYVHYEFYAILFAILILNFASNPKIKISLEHPLFTWLGNISYGLYMYHPLGIMLGIALCSHLHIDTDLVLYPVAFGITIALAGGSYRFFESYFLRFKPRFSKIVSGNEAHNLPDKP